MNTIIQNILVFITVALAMGYIIRKYIWSPKKKSTTKACGGDDGCGCH